MRVLDTIANDLFVGNVFFYLIWHRNGLQRPVVNVVKAI
jgi:hypothetical protein